MTAQIGDRLILDGEEARMAAAPPLPANSVYVVAAPAEECEGWCSACWRGYVATWEIEGDRLYLAAIDGFGASEPTWRMKTEQRLFADWFSGALRVPRGRKLHCVHMGFETIYEREELIEIDAGVVVKREMVDHRGALH